MPFIFRLSITRVHNIFCIQNYHYDGDIISFAFGHAITRGILSFAFGLNGHKVFCIQAHHYEGDIKPFAFRLTIARGALSLLPSDSPLRGGNYCSPLRGYIKSFAFRLTITRFAFSFTITRERIGLLNSDSPLRGTLIILQSDSTLRWGHYVFFAFRLAITTQRGR